MKHFNIRLTIAFFTATFVIFQFAVAQDDCKVILDKISGHYEGDCKKGLAHGTGTASGEDTYVGEFKKGLPDGSGKYTFANGNIYTGEFKKGEMDGEGKLQILLDNGSYQIQTGFWADNEYIGEHETPYDVQYKSAEVLSVRVNKTENPAGDGNALFIEIMHRGRTQNAPDFSINVTTGNMMTKYIQGSVTKVLVAKFPFGFSIGYKGETVEMSVYQPASWNIKVDLNK